MADGFIRWYRESGATSVFAEQVELFEAHGIGLVHPVKGAAMVIDVEGGQVLMSQEELGRLLSLRFASITMDWWFSADTNVIDGYEYQPFGCEIQTLWLDGLTLEEADTVEAAVVAAATGLPTPTRAVIVDRRGAGDPDDWDSAVLYDGERLPVIRDRVLVRDPLAEKLLRMSPELRSEETGAGLTLLSPARPL
ncbi:hypothetical protein G5C60_36400 [Streptomyces sp. HC44]|uniref:Uncharacterized protein n=1 Tax=Streptomyces scabichelini TaxID=2711217 RepID=A0A6G4VGB7_9ACTN|nr:hypothetical protein [Streptomyces scabichelini]NGO12935.1 hypothetical protein [Streptomyces scabichelini]